MPEIDHSSPDDAAQPQLPASTPPPTWGRVGILLRSVLFAITAVFRTTPLCASAVLVTTLAMGVIPMAMVYTGRLVLDGVVAAVQSQGAPLQLRLLLYAVFAQTAVSFGQSVLQKLNGHITFRVGRRLNVAMAHRVLSHASRLDLKYFDTPVFYDKMLRARRESSSRPVELIQLVLNILRSSITFATMAGMILSVSPLLAAVMVLVTLPLMIVNARFGKKNYDLQFIRTEQQRLADHLADTLTNRTAVPEVMSFRLADFLFGRWHAAACRFMKQDISLNHRQTWAQSFAEVLLILAHAGSIIYLAHLGMRGPDPMTPGQILMYAGAFLAGVNACRGVTTSMSSIYENALFLSNLLEFEQFQPTIESDEAGRPAPPVIESLELQNVSFTYPAATTRVLRNLSVRFQRSESTLIVGLNGAGKTTLLRLLLRLYDPTEGRILLNGIDLREFDVHSLRQRMSVIFQRFLELPFSVRENIGCGSVENIEDMARITRASVRARVDPFVRKLPKEYDTILGRAFSDGHELSQGQWQRLCLARLFMKDAPVLIFDEPTASVDVDTEAHLFSEIREMSRDKICILVSHRALHPNAADRFVLVSDGAVAEQGNFDDLIAEGGEFARLWRVYTQMNDEPVVSVASPS